MSDCSARALAPRERECLIEVIVSDGTVRRWPLNLEDAHVIGVQVDGELLEPANVDEHYECDKRSIRAIVLEGVRYVPAPARDYDGEVD